MSRAGRAGWRSLRVRLAVLGFLGGYVPVLLLFGVVLVTETDTSVQVDNGVDVRDTTSARSPWVTWTVVGLGPGAAGLAWWWAGRAVRPIERIRAVAEEIEETDLSRRIGLGQGPAEVVSLAASFDAMLDRLQAAAETQRRLIEETSHELRVPLSVLTTNAEVLLAHPAPDVELWRQGLERSRRAAGRLSATIDGLLVEARGRARTLDRAPVDLMALVREVAADTGAEDVRVTGPPRAVCPVDEPTVRRAVANLVDNALRHGAGGVRVEVELTGTEAAITVSDQGPGIPEEQRDHIFERFWRGRPDTPGTGLGLPIARQVALAHGGHLALTSPGPSGHGCTFRLTLRR